MSLSKSDSAVSRPLDDLESLLWVLEDRRCFSFLSFFLFLSFLCCLSRSSSLLSRTDSWPELACLFFSLASLFSSFSVLTLISGRPGVGGREGWSSGSLSESRAGVSSFLLALTMSLTDGLVSLLEAEAILLMAALVSRFSSSLSDSSNSADAVTLELAAFLFDDEESLGAEADEVELLEADVLDLREAEVVELSTALGCSSSEDEPKILFMRFSSSFFSPFLLEAPVVEDISFLEAFSFLLREDEELLSVSLSFLDFSFFLSSLFEDDLLLSFSSDLTLADLLVGFSFSESLDSGLVLAFE